MKIALLVLTAISVYAADARLSFSKSFPGSKPAYFLITVERDGTASYNETEDADNAEAVKLEASAANQMFALADKLDHFKKPIESGLKVANTGQKTLRWENGDEKSETKYNYSTIEDARQLTDYFERIAESARDVAVKMAKKRRPDSHVTTLVGRMDTELRGAQMAHRSMVEAALGKEPGAESVNEVMIGRTLVARHAIATVEIANIDAITPRLTGVGIFGISWNCSWR